jgi:hypothetical protein
MLDGPLRHIGMRNVVILEQRTHPAYRSRPKTPKRYLCGQAPPTSPAP